MNLVSKFTRIQNQVTDTPRSKFLVFTMVIFISVYCSRIFFHFQNYLVLHCLFFAFLRFCIKFFVSKFWVYFVMNGDLNNIKSFWKILIYCQKNFDLVILMKVYKVIKIFWFEIRITNELIMEQITNTVNLKD